MLSHLFPPAFISIHLCLLLLCSCMWLIVNPADPTLDCCVSRNLRSVSLLDSRASISLPFEIFKERSEGPRSNLAKICERYIFFYRGKYHFVSIRPIPTRPPLFLRYRAIIFFRIRWILLTFPCNFAADSLSGGCCWLQSRPSVHVWIALIGCRHLPKSCFAI